MCIRDSNNVSFFEAVDKTASLGLLYIGTASTQPVSENIHKKFDYNLSPGEVKQIKTKLDSAGLRLLTYYISTLPEDPEQYRKIFQFGRRMGIEIFIADPTPQLPLDQLEKLCQKFDIKLAFHNKSKQNNPDYWNVKQLQKLCKNRSDKIGLCFDLGEWMSSGLKPVDAVKALKDRLFVIQLHDLDELPGSGHAVPWGTGVGQIGNLLQQVRKHCHNSILFGIDTLRNLEYPQEELKKNTQFFNEFTIEQVRNLK